MTKSITITFISDTHQYHPDIDYTDVIVHSGDFCNSGVIEEFENFIDWYGRLPHKYKILVAGNHDKYFMKHPELAEELVSDFIYLKDSYCTIEGFKFYGSPWQPRFGRDWAFNLDYQEQLKEKWSRIPIDTDVLVTHTPPNEILDKCYDGDRAGCKELSKRVFEVNPVIHAFGHIHEARGIDDISSTMFINSSMPSKAFSPITVKLWRDANNKPIARHFNKKTLDKLNELTRLSQEYGLPM